MGWAIRVGQHEAGMIFRAAHELFCDVSPKNSAQGDGVGIGLLIHWKMLVIHAGKKALIRYNGKIKAFFLLYFLSV